jgi:hypothetical protein
MKERLRFTGENPPRSLWARYPNWENAIDEEGFADQVFNDDAQQIGVTQQPRESRMDGDW